MGPGSRRRRWPGRRQWLRQRRGASKCAWDPSGGSGRPDGVPTLHSGEKYIRSFKELCMRNVISLVAGAAFVAALAMPAFAADMTVKGEVVDVACSTSKKEAGKGAAHASCAMVCAKKGQP